jgi:hypothetical protein
MFLPVPHPQNNTDYVDVMVSTIHAYLHFSPVSLYADLDAIPALTILYWYTTVWRPGVEGRNLGGLCQTLLPATQPVTFGVLWSRISWVLLLGKFLPA